MILELQPDSDVTVVTFFFHGQPLQTEHSEKSRDPLCLLYVVHKW